MKTYISDLKHLIKNMEDDKDFRLAGQNPTGEPMKFHINGESYLVKIDIENLKRAVAKWDEEEIESLLGAECQLNVANLRFPDGFPTHSIKVLHFKF
tara:strand:- start:949 stop:1239 length:291 start_codon:yes stop_codon:yes gene_type:complete